MAYNTTNITNANNIYEIYVALNMLSGDILALLTLFTIFIIGCVIYTSFRENISDSIIASALITSVFAFVFWAGGLIEWYFISFPVIIFFGAMGTRALSRS